MAIGYLRDKLLETLNIQKSGIKEGDICYVITVPAIWNDNAKQFMREAAMKVIFVVCKVEPDFLVSVFDIHVTTYRDGSISFL